MARKEHAKKSKIPGNLVNAHRKTLVEVEVVGVVVS